MDNSVWENKKVLVTGSEGFIGSHLTEKLIDLGADVRAFVFYNSFNKWGWLEGIDKEKLKKIEIFTGDIRDSGSARRCMEDIDTVFHLAALIAIPYSYYSPESYVETNVKGTLNLLQAAKDNKISKFVHTSTSEVYGTAIYAPIDEKHPLQGQSPYSASKIGADMMAYSYYCSFNKPVAICRPFNTYGPRQSARAVISTIISQIAAGSKELKLGSLDPVRDMNYVADTVTGFIKIGETEKSTGQVINIGSGVGVTIGELVERIKAIMKSDIPVIEDRQRIRPQKSEVMKLICSNVKAKQLLDWQPEYSLDDGLKEVVRFISNNIGEYKPDLYNI